MTEKSDRFLSLDEFKEKVYSNVGLLESLDEARADKNLDSERGGCFGLFVPLWRPMMKQGLRITRQRLKIGELEKKADALLARKEIKDALCDKLDATVSLPIDAAYKLTPVLYALALEDEEKVPFDALLCAIICRKIVKQGVENFCPGQ